MTSAVLLEQPAAESAPSAQPSSAPSPALPTQSRVVSATREGRRASLVDAVQSPQAGVSSVNWPGTISSGTRAALTSARAFRELSTADQQRFLNVLDSVLRHESDATIRNRAEADSVALATTTLGGRSILLQKDASADQRTLLDHLHRLATAERHQYPQSLRLVRDKVLASLIAEVANPEAAINQGRYDVCGQTTALQQIADRNPAEYAGLLTRTIFNEGASSDTDVLNYEFQPVWVSEEQRVDRSYSEAIILNMLGRGQSLLPHDMERVYERLFGQGFTRVDDRDEIIDELAASSAEGRANSVTLYWNYGGSSEYHTLRAVAVLRESDLQHALTRGDGSQVLNIGEGPGMVSIPVTEDLRFTLSNGAAVVMWNPFGERYPNSEGVASVPIDKERSLFWIDEATFRDHAYYALVEGGAEGVTDGLPPLAEVDPDRATRDSSPAHLPTTPRLEGLFSKDGGHGVFGDYIPPPDLPYRVFREKDRQDGIGEPEFQVGERFTAWSEGSHNRYEQGPASGVIAGDVMARLAASQRSVDDIAELRLRVRDTLPPSVSQASEELARILASAQPIEARRREVQRLLLSRQSLISGLDERWSRENRNFEAEIEALFGDRKQMPRFLASYFEGKDAERADRTFGVDAAISTIQKYLNQGDGDALVDYMAELSPNQRQLAAEAYRRNVGAELIEAVRSEFGDKSSAAIFVSSLISSDGNVLASGFAHAYDRLLASGGMFSGDERERAKNWLFKILEARAAMALESQQAPESMDAALSAHPRVGRSFEQALAELRRKGRISIDELNSLNELYNGTFSDEKRRYLEERAEHRDRGIGGYNYRDVLGAPLDALSGRLRGPNNRGLEKGEDFSFLGELSQETIQSLSSYYRNKFKRPIEECIPGHGEYLTKPAERAEREMAYGYLYGQPHRVEAARIFLQSREYDRQWNNRYQGAAVMSGPNPAWIAAQVAEKYRLLEDSYRDMDAEMQVQVARVFRQIADKDIEEIFSKY